MLHSEQVFRIIIQNNSPFWKLFVFDTPYAKSKLIASYDGDDLEEKKDEKDRDSLLNRSVQVLQSHLEIYRNNIDLSFELVMRPTRTSNGEKILGPYRFTILPVSPQVPAGPGFSGNGFNPVAGLGNVPPQMYGLGDYVPKQQLSDIVDLMSQKNQLLIEKTLLDRDKKDHEDEKKAFDSDAKDWMKEHSDISNMYMEASKKGMLTALGQAMKLFVDGTPLQGISTQNSASAETAEEKLIEKFVQELLEKNLTIEELTSLINIFSITLSKHIQTKGENGNGN
jgi:hypothetical protein